MATEGPRTAVRLGEQDKAILETIRDHHGLGSESAAIRFLIRQEGRRIGASQGKASDVRPVGRPRKKA